jgi:flagellar capping protein FliD
LSIDTDKLQGYLNTNFNDVKNLFSANGSANAGTLEYVSNSRDTEAGEYKVNITTAATQSTSTSNNGIVGENETLTITDGDKVAEIALTTDMTLSGIKNAINSEMSKVYMDITATDDGSGHLVLSHDNYGSDYNFTISEDAASSGNKLWTGGDQTVNNGVDVAGTINGEAATGSGQILKGDDGENNIDGLVIKYTGTAEGLDVGNVKLTLGTAELFDRVLFNITDSYDGYLAFKQDSLQNNIDSYEIKIEEMEARLDRKMEMMINRFVAMESALSVMQSQSQWLTGQINASYSGWG